MIYKVHELAKILQISTAATKQWLKKYGTEAKSHMSRVSEDVAEKLIKEFKISPHHKTYSKRIKETELYQLASDYKIFIDTCSLLHSGAEAIFSKKLLQVLSETNNKIIIPTKVIEEIYNHTKSQNLELKKRSHYAINILAKHKENNIIDIRGEESDSFADNLLIAIFTKFRMRHNLCLITQDLGLSEEILKLGNTTKAVNRNIKKIKVFRISNNNELVEFSNHHSYNKIKNYDKRTNTLVSKIQKFDRHRTPASTNDKNLKCSKMPSVGDYVFSDKFGKIKLISEISKGGEGIVYMSDKKFVCKIYKKERLKQNKYSKLSIMVKNPIVKSGICWPIDLLSNIHHEFVGYAMDKAEGIELQKSVFLPMLLRKRFPSWNRYNLVKLCETILNLISYLHERNVIIGDINPFNILVKSDNEVYFIDTDSFQIENYPCTVGTVNFTAPEIQGKNYKTFLRTMEHECFAITTLLFMILLPGKPPYSQQGGGNPSSNIKNQDFSYPLGEKSNHRTPPGGWRFIWSNLPYKIKEAFYNTFRNNKRLSVDEWKKLIEFYINDLQKNYVSDDLFPQHFKLIDPVEVICEKCGRKYTESEQFVNKLRVQGKNPICIECWKNLNVVRLNQTL